MASVSTPAPTLSSIFSFDHDHGVPARTLADRLGGKGAGLAEMTTALGLPVPPGFTIAVPVCRDYLAGGWPDGLSEVIDRHCADLGRRLGRSFGDPEDPLLLAVRSGAPRSMPGMLDTVLNLGLTPATVDGLARAAGDDVFAWDCYRRFVRMYATTVLGCPHDRLGEDLATTDADDLRADVERLRGEVRVACGADVPDDPAVQLRAAIEAVFRSCGSARAQAYRRRERMGEDLATAVNVQAMVFGNRGTDSGTGVVFTRDPATGHPTRYGDYLRRAQGEDVVAGIAHTQPIDELATEMPAVWSDLDAILSRLEHHYADICDVEFTVEQGRLWVLQTRVGKRSALAAVRAAVQMAEEPGTPLTRQEAAARVGDDVRAAARAAVVAAAGAQNRGVAVARGLGASPGRVTGQAVFTSEAAADLADEDEDASIVLLRPETSPDDVPGMAVSAGVVTATGGLVSHAAVVARGWGLPAVVGAGSLVIDETGARTADGLHRIAPGDDVTLDGTTGEVWLGCDPDALDAEPPDVQAILADALPELLRLEEWSAVPSAAPPNNERPQG
jgi:pyruvate,orthophosphate dikinase